MAELGGYDCEFVEKPPEPFQSECPVCLLILCEPQQATCCGYGFCQSCIEGIKLQKTPCPCCKADKFESFEDKRLKRTLSGYKVYCTNKSSGCEWMGELGDMKRHLNLNPTSHNKRLEGCSFAQVACVHCANMIQRSGLTVHESEQCPVRPFSCQYCKEYNSNYQDVTMNHWLECAYFPVPCPMGCNQSIERRNFHCHINSSCEFKNVECEFAKVGCVAKLLRKDMPAHLSNELGHHMSLLLQNQTKIQAENAELKVRCDTLEEENKQQAIEFVQLDAKYKQLILKQEELETTHDRVINKHSAYHVELTHEMDTLKEDLQTLQLAKANRQQSQPSLGMPLQSVEVTMYGFEYYKKSQMLWFSPSFYTHPYGYKMCLGVDAHGWGGSISTKKSNISVCIYMFLMKGEYDDLLKWPFQGHVTVDLLNQTGGQNQTKVISFTSHGTRVILEKRAPCGPGIMEFITHSDLLSGYLKNGSLLFRISKVEF